MKSSPKFPCNPGIQSILYPKVLGQKLANQFKSSYWGTYASSYVLDAMLIFRENLTFSKSLLWCWTCTKMQNNEQYFSAKFSPKRFIPLKWNLFLLFPFNVEIFIFHNSYKNRKNAYYQPFQQNTYKMVCGLDQRRHASPAHKKVFPNPIAVDRQ